MEENRELDEQNRELEEDNTRLRERLRKGEPVPAFPGAARRAQGLAALMGQRPREDAPRQDKAGEPPAPGSEEHGQVEPPVGTPQDEPEQQAQVSPAEPDGRQGRLDIEQAPSADALLKQWYQRYPKTFFKGHTRPLKVGIHHDLAAREPWPEKLVRRALAGYVNLPRYLKAVREGAERIDLDGQPAGSVDTQAAEHAKRKLERLQGERRERTPRREGELRRQARPRRQSAGTAPGKASSVSKETRGSVEPTSTASEAPRTLEEKLVALQAKHNRR
ncbi:ProQ/FinO family protein [Halomonas sp. MCCC 1A11036]|uniref:ProQ/FinO family protein n=2 Tax=Billgrantia zhangzhouensis TaxID=2733481 RepID=A0ABS9AFN3_9GAMM|nr:ProQ/FinO family protein [Halomonas zhangzhouensis]